MNRAAGRALLRGATLMSVVALVVAAGPAAVSGGQAAQATVTITKVTDPAVDPQDFQFVNSFPVSSPTGNILDTDPTSSVPLSSYSFGVSGDDLGFVYVSETEPSGWTLTDILCTGDEEVSYNVDGNNVSLDVDLGENIACTFYNTKRAQLTLQKVTVPAQDPQGFDFDLTGGAVPADYDLDTDPASMFTGSNITWSVNPDDLGDYTITETAVSGWSLTSLACIGNTDGDTLTSLVDRVVDFEIDAGELIICTFTNTKAGFESQAPSNPPSTEPSTEPSVEPSTEPSEAPSAGASGEPSGDASVQPSSDQGGETDQASAPGTDTDVPGSTGPNGTNAVLLAVVLVALSGLLLVTRPRKQRS